MTESYNKYHEAAGRRQDAAAMLLGYLFFCLILKKMQERYVECRDNPPI